MYVALFLKSRNRSTSEKSRSAWQLKLELFLKDCSHAEFIQNHAARGSPKNVARSNLKSAPGTGGGSGGNGHGSVPRNSSQAGVGRARRFLPDSVTDGGDGMHEMQRRMVRRSVIVLGIIRGIIFHCPLCDLHTCALCC